MKRFDVLFMHKLGGEDNDTRMALISLRSVTGGGNSTRTCSLLRDTHDFQH